MKGVDSRGPDLFSNASLLSMLSRSGTSSSVRSSSKGACSTSQDKSSRKRSDKEAPSSSSVAKRPLSSPSSSRYKVKETPERISNGPNIYVSEISTFLNFNNNYLTCRQILWVNAANRC